MLLALSVLFYTVEGASMHRAVEKGKHTCCQKSEEKTKTPPSGCCGGKGCDYSKSCCYGFSYLPVRSYDMVYYPSIGGNIFGYSITAISHYERAIWYPPKA